MRPRWRPASRNASGHRQFILARRTLGGLVALAEIGSSCEHASAALRFCFAKIVDCPRGWNFLQVLIGRLLGPSPVTIAAIEARVPTLVEAAC
jgi:hypothetical protein